MLAHSAEKSHHNVPTLTAKQSLLVQSLLQHKNELLQAIQVLPEGHVHVVLPQQMKQNISWMRQVFGAYDIEPRIFVSHKPSKSNVLIKQARAENTGLDVSSKNELISALKNGFSGQKICCTGSKNEEYLSLSIQQGCLHSLDSIEELERYIDLCKQIAPHEQHKILLRINSADAPYGGKMSRFGIPVNNLETCFNLLKENSNVYLEGFHMHSGESSGEMRAQEVTLILHYMQRAHALGFTPHTVNIGGGFPRTFYESKSETEAFTDSLIQSLSTKKDITWRGYSYGLSLTDKGAVVGRAGLESLFKCDDFECTLRQMLDADSINASVHKVMGECGFDFMIEPGVNAYDACGVTLFKVVEVQDKNNQTLTVLDGNKYNVQFDQIEYMADPVLISEDEIDKKNESFSTYLVGNLCAEFDVMVKRKVVLNGKPKAGDYLCFMNTAGYTADFNETSVHQHPIGQKIVALKKENGWKFMSEDRFNPYDLIERL
tara:strand:- start:151121 stop:152587 length:1467 start_codon:yes stop_codon:yes gene_type:complete